MCIRDSPTLAFISGGVGEAEDGIPPQPYETFCYDSALLQAKIENFNVIPYTAVLPKELHNNIVPVDSVASHFKHGAVLEVIMAANGANIHEHRAIATGLGVCWGCLLYASRAKRTLWNRMWSARP